MSSLRSHPTSGIILVVDLSKVREAMIGVPDPFGDHWYRMVYDLTTIGVATYSEICAMHFDELLELWEYSVDRWNSEHPTK